MVVKSFLWDTLKKTVDSNVSRVPRSLDLFSSDYITATKSIEAIPHWSANPRSLSQQRCLSDFDSSFANQKPVTANESDFITSLANQNREQAEQWG